MVHTIPLLATQEVVALREAVVASLARAVGQRVAAAAVAKLLQA